MTPAIAPFQHTLNGAVGCCGVGLHSGKPVSLTIKPAPPESGLCFIHRELPGHPRLAAHMTQVVDTKLATTLGNQHFRIATVEHLLAALHGYGVDNADIEVDGPEVPIMDGSGAPFLQLLQRSGLRQQPHPRKLLRITKPIHYHDGDKRLSIQPHDGFKISGEICFDDTLIRRQRYTFDFSPNTFAREIAAARTFGYVEQVEELWSNGLALGSSLANVIAIHWNRRSVLNEEGLRFEDEFIRHKILDLLGDLALLGHRLLGHVTFCKTGHTQHLGLLRAIITSPRCWELVEMVPCHLRSHPRTTTFAAEDSESLVPLYQGLMDAERIILR